MARSGEGEEGGITMDRARLLKDLKTDKARRAYAEEEDNWEGAGASLFGCVCLKQLKGFRIFRLMGWCKGFCEAYPDHFSALYTFEGSSDGYVIIDDLRSSAKISAAMKRQMEEWEE